MWLACHTLISAVLLPSNDVAAQTYTLIKSFGVLTNATGGRPQSRLVQGLDGTLYGTTSDVEGNVTGVVFKMQPDGSGFGIIRYFTNSLEGTTPTGGLTRSGNILYGTTLGGGSLGWGTIFKINMDGSGYTVLKHFTSDDGARPLPDLVISDSTLYGTTERGGSNNCGTVFKIEADGSGYTVLKHLDYDYDGGVPKAGLLLVGSKLYGTASQGGFWGYGTVFRLNTNGTAFVAWRQFAYTDGAYPNAPVVFTSGNQLCGTTSGGGSAGWGTAFKMDTEGPGFALLKHFSSTNGESPHGALMLPANTLYGTTFEGGNSNKGTVFKMNTDGSGYAVLKHFTGTDGAHPLAGLLLYGNTLYGTTSRGGSADKGGVFALSVTGSNYTMLKNFVNSDAANPRAGLARSGSVLFGTTRAGGDFAKGTVFQVNTNGNGYGVIRHFAGSDGGNPQATLTKSNTY